MGESGLITKKDWSLREGSKTADYQTANARLSQYSAWLGGVAWILLIVSINTISGKTNGKSDAYFAAETVTVLGLLVAIVFYLMSASTLASPYYGASVSQEMAIRRSRRLQIAANFLTFVALSALLLVVFDFSAQGVLYSAAAVVIPVVWLTVRQAQRIPL